jgi:hypothetical protein
MRHVKRPPAEGQGLPGSQTAEMTLGNLVSLVYDSASPTEQRLLLEYLRQLVGGSAQPVRAGAKLSTGSPNSGQPGQQAELKEASQVTASEIASLVEQVQQAGHDWIGGLVCIVAGLPKLSSSAAASLLVTISVDQARFLDKVSHDVSQR